MGGNSFVRDAMDSNRICIIAGMPRAGTTFLYHTLAKHPAVFVPSRKETDYFSLNYYRGQSWYLSFFRELSGYEIGFDISPIYFMDKKSVQRMVEFNSDVRVILIVRPVIDWILSFYKHLQAKQYGKISFDDFLNGYSYKKDSRKLPLEFKKGSVKPTILKYCETFGDNLLLCDYRTLNQNPLAVLKQIERFAGVERFFSESNFENIRLNASDAEPPKIINILMQQKLFADLTVKLFPKNWILSIRSKLQGSKSVARRDVPKKRLDNKKIELARELFVEDSEFISVLFERGSFLLGGSVQFD